MCCIHYRKSFIPTTVEFSFTHKKTNQSTTNLVESFVMYEYLMIDNYNVTLSRSYAFLDA